MSRRSLAGDMNRNDRLSAVLGRAALCIVAVVLSGCSLDNGMPQDLVDHLKARHILVQPTRVHAPLSQRGGFVVTRYDAQVVAAIVSAFSLEPIQADDPHWVTTAQTIGATVAAREIWGVSGRPVQLKLQDDGQFEYVYLLVAQDGDVYLFAEYAYG